MAERNIRLRRQARALFAKAGARCAECGEPIDYSQPSRVNGRVNPAALEADHVQPLARGGTDTLDNLRPLHAACNRAKGDRLHSNILRTTGVLG